jgi:hypothetical protein
MRLILLLGLTILSAAPASKEVLYDIEEFNEVYAKFYRRLHGCPQDATRIQECKEGTGVFDVQLWKEVKKKGRVFGE